MTAADEAARLLHSAEDGYARTYGTTPLNNRVELAKAWIDLARIEALTATQGEEPRTDD